MKTKLIIVLATIFFFSALESLFAQDLGPQFKKVSEGIYVYAAVLNEANSTIVLTQDGVVEKQMATSPEIRAAFKDFRLITPHIYHDRMTLNAGERTMELYYLKTFIVRRIPRSGYPKNACHLPPLRSESNASVTTGHSSAFPIH